MPSTRLTQRRVDALKPRKQSHDVRDPGLKGFGVRILPSGDKRYFLHSQSEGKRIWHTIGDAGAITLDDGRSRARALLAARQNGNSDNPDSCDSIPFETVADEVFGRYGRHWKPRTLAVNFGYYRKQILSWFRANRFPTSRAMTSCNGMPRFMQRRLPPTAPHRSSLSYSNRLKPMAATPKVPIHAPESSATGGVVASGSFQPGKYAA